MRQVSRSSGLTMFFKDQGSWFTWKCMKFDLPALHGYEKKLRFSGTSFWKRLHLPGRFGSQQRWSFVHSDMAKVPGTMVFVEKTWWWKKTDSFSIKQLIGPSHRPEVWAEQLLENQVVFVWKKGCSVLCPFDALGMYTYLEWFETLREPLRHSSDIAVTWYHEPEQQLLTSTNQHGCWKKAGSQVLGVSQTCFWTWTAGIRMFNMLCFRFGMISTHNTTDNTK